MASASAFTSTLCAVAATQIQACNVKQELATNSSARLGVASPSSILRATFPSARTAQVSQPSVRILCKSASSESTVLDKEDEEEAEEEISPLTPTTLQVQSLLLDVCDGTSIAELKLKVGAFELHMKRDLRKKKVAPAPLAPVATEPVVAAPRAPVAAVTSPASSPKSNTSATSSILPATVSKTAFLFGMLEAAADQGLSFVTSPKVGVFRRGRTVKGKVGKPLIEEGLTIKEGQVVGYVEQLGTQQPVEAQVSGEVVQLLWDDGESVGYGDPLIAIRPSFAGIISKAALN